MSRARLDLEGIAASNVAAVVTADVPGIGAVASRALVYEPMQFAFAPAAIDARAGDAVPVRVTVTPPPAAPVLLPITVIDPSVASVPGTVDLDASGIGSFIVNLLTTGTTRIEVHNPDGGNEPALLAITARESADAPSVSAIAPSSGPSTGGTAFTASGANLAVGCAMAFGDAPATDVSVDAGGTLRGVTPRHAPGIVDVVLTCGRSRAVMPGAFTYVDTPPFLDAIAPATGSTNGGTLVRAAGGAFESGCWMFFGGVPAPFADFESPVALTAAAPARANAAVVEVSVRCGLHITTLPAAFTYRSAEDPPPSIATVEPRSAAPGESATIRGAGFRRDHVVRFGDVEATVLRMSGDAIVARIPELPPGMRHIAIGPADGPAFLVTEAPPPHVASVSPQIPQSASDIIVTGSGFRPVHSFSLGQKRVRTISLEYDRVILRVPHDIPSGSYPIRIDDSDSGVFVTVLATSGWYRDISPPCGPTTGGTAVQILAGHGSYYVAVTFNGVPAVFLPGGSEDQIFVVAPPGVTGYARLQINDFLRTDAFRYVSPFDPNGCRD